MSQDLATLFRFGDHGKNSHRNRAVKTDQQIDLAHLRPAQLVDRFPRRGELKG
jgi:hypothetical protein